MEKKKRFIECLLPSSFCNLRCEYCYVIQQNRRKGIIKQPKYSIETMLNGLKKERLGGACFFSICAIGETLIPSYLFSFVKGLLEEGHYVNLTNNGTATNRIIEYCTLPKELLSHLHFGFSFHYIELKKQNLLKCFFENVKRVKEAGCSFIVKLNLCDAYIDSLEEIKQVCLDNLGVYPVVSITRAEEKGKYKLYTQDERCFSKSGAQFNSKMFSFTNHYFNKKIRKFCYAGDWSFLLNLENGILSKCYCNHEDSCDIFADVTQKIDFQAVGRHCRSRYCVNADHFITQGIVPSIHCDGYADIRTDSGRRAWYKKEFFDFSNQKLEESNTKYSFLKKVHIDLYYLRLFIRKIIKKY